MNICSSVLLSAALAAILTLRFLLPTWGCVTASPPGTYVNIASEEALIVWDPAAHTEQFIRRASFFGQAPQFGFLVPTPTPPKLSEIDDSVFHDLVWTYHPHLVTQPQYGLKLISLFERHYALRTAGTAVLATVGAQHVSVMDSEQVAGYDAVVLRADDAGALTGWLSAHGYRARPAMRAWLQPYVDRHWAITAFKMAKPDTRQPALSSGTVRMSFTTDRPFFPYSEPVDQRDGTYPTAQRLLRIYCLSPARMEGALDGSAARWPGSTHWAGPLPPDQRPWIIPAVGLSGSPVASKLWLTAFEDKSSPRSGVADLYFTPAAQQTPVVPTVVLPEDRRIGIPVELLAGAVIVFAVLYRKRRRSHPTAAVLTQ